MTISTEDREDTERKDDALEGKEQSDRAAAARDEQEGDEGDEAPKDLRGALKHAFAKEREKEETEETDKIKVKEYERTKPRREEKKEDKLPESRVPGDKDKVDEVKVSPEKVEESKLDPPPFWKNKGKEVWDNLSVAAQKAIAQREKEVSDGFAQYGEMRRAFSDIAQVIQPRMRQIQEFGVTPAQTIDRLFQWMEALSSPNQKVGAFKALAQSFGVNLAQLIPQEGEIDQTQTIHQDQPPPWAHQFAGRIEQIEQETRRQQELIQAQQRAAAGNFLSNWAKDKPHYEQVKGTMKALLENVIPLNADGSLNLDEAYKRAVAADPEVSAQVQQEAAAKAKAEAEERKRKDAAAAAERLRKAKIAGSGLKPAAPMVSVSQVKPNGKVQQSSVRDSLRESIQQLSE